jgi:hypothetical protein
MTRTEKSISPMSMPLCSEQIGICTANYLSWQAKNESIHPGVMHLSMEVRGSSEIEIGTHQMTSFVKVQQNGPQQGFKSEQRSSVD